MPMNFLDQRGGAVTRSGNHNLLNRTENEIKGDQHLRHGTGEMAHLRTERVDCFFGPFAPTLLIEDVSESRKIQRRY